MYEELTVAYREMEGGMPEIKAYERFGERCGVSEYKMLSVLLIQNMKKGNQEMIGILEREAASAMEGRKRRAKIRGEQVSAKLLVPMLLQLMVVLSILLIPAFMSFYS